MSRLNERFDLYVQTEEVPEAEEAPVLLKNSTFAESAEGVTASFGLPARGEMDPTSVMSLCYVFFFGLMLSDAAYGLIVFLACFILLKKFPRMGSGLKKSIRPVYVLRRLHIILGRHVRRIFRRCGECDFQDVFRTGNKHTGRMVYSP